MAKRIFKWIGKGILVIVALALLCYAYIWFNIRSRMEKVYQVQVKAFSLPTDTATITKGQHLVKIKGCTDCHGQNLAGKIMNDDAMLGLLVAPNLTAGKGGIGSTFSETDWIKALQHGLGQNNKSLILMPSHEMAQLSQEDMGAIIAYCRQVKPVDNSLPNISIGFVARIFGYLDKFVLLPAEKINHSAALPNAPDISSPVAYGKYLSVSCQGCHRPDMKGGGPLAPGMLPVPDLTATGATGKYTYEQFMRILRTGKRPDGSQINNDNMPWKMTAEYDQKEIEALYQFLKSEK